MAVLPAIARANYFLHRSGEAIMLTTTIISETCSSRIIKKVFFFSLLSGVWKIIEEKYK